jgi:hypothetical protein
MSLIFKFLIIFNFQVSFFRKFNLLILILFYLKEAQFTKHECVNSKVYYNSSDNGNSNLQKGSFVLEIWDCNAFIDSYGSDIIDSCNFTLTSNIISIAYSVILISGSCTVTNCTFRNIRIDNGKELILVNGNNGGNLIMTNSRFLYTTTVDDFLSYNFSSVIKIFESLSSSFTDCLFNSYDSTSENGGGIINAVIINTNVLKVESCTFINCSVHKKKANSGCSGNDHSCFACGGGIYARIESGGQYKIYIFLYSFYLFN